MTAYGSSGICEYETAFHVKHGLGRRPLRVLGHGERHVARPVGGEALGGVMEVFGRVA